MNEVSIIGALVIGILAGWIAEQIMGREHGMITNLVVGIVGAFLGAFIANAVGFGFAGFWGSLIVSTVGAIVLLAIVGMFRGRRATQTFKDKTVGGSAAPDGAAGLPMAHAVGMLPHPEVAGDDNVDEQSPACAQYGRAGPQSPFRRSCIELPPDDDAGPQHDPRKPEHTLDAMKRSHPGDPPKPCGMLWIARGGSGRHDYFEASVSAA